MADHGYNPDFFNEARRKQALARMRRMMREAEEEAARLERAARAAADAILDAAVEEARQIMARAYEAQRRPRRPVAEIIREVAAEHGMPAHALRGRRVPTRAARRARQDAIWRAVRERPDLTYADIGRIFGMSGGSVVQKVVEHG